MEGQFVIELLTPVHPTQLERVTNGIAARVKTDPEKIRRLLDKGIGKVSGAMSREKAERLADVFRDNGLDVKVVAFKPLNVKPIVAPPVTPEPAAAAPASAAARPSFPSLRSGAAAVASQDAVPEAPLRPKEKVFNPWLSILSAPRQTLRWVLEQNLNYNLAIVVAVGVLLGFYSGRPMNISGRLLNIVFYTVSGLIAYYLVPGIFYLCGKVLKAQGTFGQVQTAYAWGQLPLLYGTAVQIVLWLLALLLGRVSLGLGDFLLASARFLGYLAALWAYVVQIKVLAEALRISAWLVLAITLIPLAFVAIYLMLVIIPELFII